MKKKYRHPCPVCACTETRPLSDEAAVEIHEFLEVIAANFLSRYGQRIYRHYAKRAKRNPNSQQPWKNTDEPL
jgi:hypothetical protein